MMEKNKLKQILAGKLMGSMACVLCLFAVGGCAGSIYEPSRPVPASVKCDTEGFQGEECLEYVKYEEDYYDYSQVSAGYREYGERTQRDTHIAVNGEAGNISASVPPAVEQEVMDYEEQISMSNGTSGDFSNDVGTADDPVNDWLAEEGQTLKHVLTSWSEKSGWRLVWNTNRNYTITAGAMFRGRFADVSSALVRAFARARPAPIATFYKGNRVLVVETLEDENAYD